jgi:hypothetical protein
VQILQKHSRVAEADEKASQPAEGDAA